MNKHPRDLIFALIIVFSINLLIKIGMLFFSDYIYTISEIKTQAFVFVSFGIALLLMAEIVLFIVRIIIRNIKKENKTSPSIENTRYTDKDMTGFLWAVSCWLFPIIIFRFIGSKIITIFDLHIFQNHFDLSVAIVPYVAFRTYFHWKFYRKTKSGFPGHDT